MIKNTLKNTNYDQFSDEDVVDIFEATLNKINHTNIRIYENILRRYFKSDKYIKRIA